MAVFAVAAVLLLLSFSRRTDAQQSSISMIPTSGSLVLSNDMATGRVEVTCGPPSGISNFLISLNIKRVLHKTQQDQKLAGAVLSGEAGDTGPAQDLSGGKGTASGSLQQRSITFTMTDATCADGGMYICDAVYMVGTIPISPPATNSKNLSVIVEPGQLNPTKTPDLAAQAISSSLKLSCQGSIGTVSSADTVSWVWQYKDGGDWMPYNWTMDVSNATSYPTACSSTQTSSVTFNVSMDHQGRQYRCYIRRDGTDYVKFAGLFDPLVIHSDGSTGMTQLPTTQSGNASSSSNGERVDMGSGGRIMEILTACLVLILSLL